MAERDPQLTYRWLVPVLITVLGFCVGSWIAWITNDHLRVSGIQHSRVSDLDTTQAIVADHEKRIRDLEREIDRLVSPRGGGRGGDD